MAELEPKLGPPGYIQIGVVETRLAPAKLGLHKGVVVMVPFNPGGQPGAAHIKGGVVAAVLGEGLAVHLQTAGQGHAVGPVLG